MVRTFSVPVPIGSDRGVRLKYENAAQTLHLTSLQLVPVKSKGTASVDAPAKNGPLVAVVLRVRGPNDEVAREMTLAIVPLSSASPVPRLVLTQGVLLDHRFVMEDVEIAAKLVSASGGSGGHAEASAVSGMQVMIHGTTSLNA